MFLVFYAFVGTLVGVVYGIIESWKVMFESDGDKEQAAIAGGIIAVLSMLIWPLWLFGHGVAWLGINGYQKWKESQNEQKSK